MTNLFRHTKTMREIIKSVQLGTNELGSERHSGLPLLKMGNLTRGSFNYNKLEFIQEGNPKLNEQYILKKGNFLFNTRNTLELVGKSAVWKDGLPNAIFNNNIMRIIFTNDVSSFYLSYYFEHDIGWSKLKRIATGTTSVAAIYTRDLYNVEVILPAYPEQERIVEVLLNVDNSLEKTQAMIEKYMNIKHGLMQELLTPNSKNGSSVDLPEGWYMGTMSNIATINPANVTNLAPQTDVSFIAMEDVSGEGEILKQEVRNYGGIANKGYTAFKENDILFAKITPCMENGKGCICLGLQNGVGFGSTEFHVLRPIAIESRDFIYQWSMFPTFRIKAENQMTGSAGQKRVPARFFQEYLIPIPPLPVQQAISNILNEVDFKIRAERKLQSKLNYLKQGLMQDLLTGKVRVPFEEATE